MLSQSTLPPSEMRTVTKWPCKTRPTVAAVRKFGRQSARTSAPSAVGLVALTTGTVSVQGSGTSRSRCLPEVSRYSTPANPATESEKISYVTAPSARAAGACAKTATAMIIVAAVGRIRFTQLLSTWTNEKLRASGETQPCLGSQHDRRQNHVLGFVVQRAHS